MISLPVISQNGASPREAPRPNQQRLRVAVIGQIVPESSAIHLPVEPLAQRNLLRVKNFTHVVTDDNRLVNHVTYIKEKTKDPRPGGYSLWQMYLCSSLLLGSHVVRQGHEVELFNYIDEQNEQDELERLASYDPDLVVMSTTFILSHADLRSVGARLRRRLPRAFVVAGGHHIFTSLLYMDEAKRREYLASSVFDAFVNDTQGEAALAALLDAYPSRLETVANLLWKDARGVVHENARAREENDINSTLIDLDLVPINEGSVVHIRTARSCAFKCAFCSYPTIAGDLAVMELDNVIRTLKQLKAKGVSSVIFSDDTFNVPRTRFEKLLDRMIAEDACMPWYSFLRCQFVTPDLIKKMRRSGCQGVFLGVESGSDSILKNMNKGAKASVYFDAIPVLEGEGIFTVGSFVLGFPGETRATVEETRHFIQRAGMSYYYIQPFYYVHHTPIHKNADQFKLTGSGLFWSHATMNSGEALQLLNETFLDVTECRWVCPDGTLWEIAYLQNIGYSLSQINEHLEDINRRTRAQMHRFGLVQARN